MRAIDTNVLARFLLDDDPVQSPVAASVIAGGVAVTHTVIVELTWLLLSRYRQPRTVVAAALREVIDLPSVTVQDTPLVLCAIDRFDGGADLADMLHIVAARDSDSFASFEKQLAKQAGPDTPVPIEQLA